MKMPMNPPLRITNPATGWRRVVVVLAVAGSAAAAQAQLPLARLNWVYPAGARVGTTNEITFSGADLDDPAGLLFSDSRLSGSPKAGSPNVQIVAVPVDLPPGAYEVRFSGRFGVSNPRVFAVGTAPESFLDSTNTSPASATPLPLETVVNGRAPANNALWFRVATKAGQRLLARLETKELDSRLLPDLTVLDPGGREIAFSRRGSLLDFTPAVDGPHLLKLHDLTFRGGDEYFFRLSVGTVPHVDFALPSVLRRGETNHVTLFGRLLPGGQPSALTGADGRPLDHVTVQIPPGALGDPTGVLRKPSAASLGTGAGAWRWNSPAGLLNPLAFAWTTNAVFTTALPPASLLTTATPPCEVSGLFPRRGERSGATFSARKGDAYWIEIFADRLGPNSDPSAVVQRVTRNDKGEESTTDVVELGDTDFAAGGREFEATHRDAMARFQAPEDGQYRVVIRDLFHPGPTAVRLPYRLQIRRETPGFALAAFPQPPPRRDDNDRLIHLWTTALRRYETLPVRVVAFRQDGFNGEIEVTARNLPTGLSSLPARIPAGQAAATLLITASSNAPAAFANLGLVGRATVPGGELVRTALVATTRWPVPNWDLEKADARLSAGLAVSVVAEEDAPIEVRAGGTNRFEMVAGGKLTVPLSIIRRFEYPAAFSLKPGGHPELDKAKELAIPEKATNAVWELNLAETKLPEGEHRVTLESFVSGKYRNNPEAAEVADRDAKAAAQAATEAADRLKKVNEQLAAADKELAAADARVKEARSRTATGTDPKIQEALAQAESAMAKAREIKDGAGKEKLSAEPLAAAAEKKKSDTAALSKAATERANPRDVAVRVYSVPFLVRVNPPAK